MTDAEAVPHPGDFEAQLAERTGKINESLEALKIKVDLWDRGDAGHFRALIAELKEDQVSLLDRARSVKDAAGEEWHDIAARIMRAVERLEGEISTAWADFEAEVAEDLDTYRAASSHQVESWRSHVGNMRLQAKLGEMEARDAVADMERAFDSARPELDRAKDAASDALEAVRGSAREFVAHLRDKSRAASRTMR